MTLAVVPGSFRDPYGTVFRTAEGVIRQVHTSYRPHYDHLMVSGLYARLVSAGLMVAHEEISAPASGPDTYKVLKPHQVDFISYPYEWSFGQLKAAALATLEIQARALDLGMSLRDASAYNIQFVDGRPALIDTLSFEKYTPGEPWVAYRQFCEHFLAPLALVALRDPRLGRMLMIHLDGIPLDLAVSLLPSTARLRPSLLLHLYGHARSQRRWKARLAPRAASTAFGTLAFHGLVDSLRRAVDKLKWTPRSSPWARYYDEAESYAQDALAHKRAVVGRFLDRVRPSVVWDLGANTGAFSRLAAEQGSRTVAFDGDAACVEGMYRSAVASKLTSLLPLVVDLANPSPALGWAHRERDSLLSRGPADLVMALALVHHLAIGNNVPLRLIVELLAQLGRFVIVEFVDRDDPQVQRLLASRRHGFPDYDETKLMAALEAWFAVLERVPIVDSSRVLFLLERRAR